MPLSGGKERWIMEQLHINGQPVWYGLISGGFGNNNSYKIAVGQRPEDEVLRHADTTWCESAVTIQWSPCSAGFFDTPGRKQILFQAAIDGLKAQGLYTGALSANINEALFTCASKEKKTKIRRQVEERLRKDENFLSRVVSGLCPDLL